MFSMYYLVVSKKDLMIVVSKFFLLLGPREGKKTVIITRNGTSKHSTRCRGQGAREGTVLYMALPLRRLQGAKTCPVLPASRDPLFSPRLARGISHHHVSRTRDGAHGEIRPACTTPTCVPCALPQPPHMAAAVSYGCG